MSMLATGLLLLHYMVVMFLSLCFIFFIKGVPILYIHRGTLLLEKPSAISNTVSSKVRKVKEVFVSLAIHEDSFQQIKEVKASSHFIATIAMIAAKCNQRSILRIIRESLGSEIVVITIADVDKPLSRRSQRSVVRGRRDYSDQNDPTQSHRDSPKCTSCIMVRYIYYRNFVGILF